MKRKIVGWAKAVKPCPRGGTVGMLRFAHPTKLVQYAIKSGDNDTAAEYAVKLKALQG